MNSVGYRLRTCTRRSIRVGPSANRHVRTEIPGTAPNKREAVIWSTRWNCSQRRACPSVRPVVTTSIRRNGYEKITHKDEEATVSHESSARYVLPSFVLSLIIAVQWRTYRTKYDLEIQLYKSENICTKMNEKHSFQQIFCLFSSFYFIILRIANVTCFTISDA